MTISTQPTIAPGTYRVDPARSSVAFSVKHLFGMATVHGTLAVRDGTVVVADDPRRSHVTATVDAGSFRTGNARRDKDVTSKKFLDTSRYPTMSFEGTALTRREDGPWQLSGTLTVHGTDGHVVVIVTEEPGGLLRGTARADRHAFGVTSGKGLIGRYLDITVEVALCP
jgi:polyisoprenoid-binding protein YceI